MLKRMIGVAAMAVIAVGGFGAAFALGGEGNGHLPPGGTNPCEPSYHWNGEACEHNGDGGGNCGQNQGNNEGDHGYGHEGECTTETTPTTPTDTTPTTPTDTVPTTPTTTTPTTPTPPRVCPDGKPPTPGEGAFDPNDDCKRPPAPPVTPPVVTTTTPTTASTPAATTPVTTTPVAPQPPRKPTAAPKPKPKPAPAPKPKAAPKPDKPPAPHVCLPLADGTKRAWWKGGNGMKPGCYAIVQGSG